MKTANAKLMGALVSTNTSRVVLKKIKGKKVDKAIKFLEGLLNQKRDIDGQYHTRTTESLLKILKSAQANAKNKTMNLDKLFVREAKADKAARRSLAKSRTPHRGRVGKSSNIEIILEER